MKHEKRIQSVSPETGVHSPSQMNSYRQAFKRFNIVMLWMWRLGFRRWINAWPSVGGRIMVLIHRGRTSGITRRTPVNYCRMGKSVYCTAGFGRNTDWYLNILSNPKVEVWLPDSWWSGIAEDISAVELRDYILRHVLIASGIAAPMFGVDPRTMSPEEFTDATREYRLVRIRLEDPLSGAGGPGDLSWVWVPIATVSSLLYLLFLLQKKR